MSLRRASRRFRAPRLANSDGICNAADVLRDPFTLSVDNHTCGFKMMGVVLCKKTKTTIGW